MAMVISVYSVFEFVVMNLKNRSELMLNSFQLLMISFFFNSSVTSYYYMTLRIVYK